MDYRDPEWVAERLGLEKNTVYRFLQDGTIPGLQLGRKWLISESKLADWLNEEMEHQTHSRRKAAVSASRTVRRMANLTARARAAVREAHAEARRYGHARLGQEHLLLALLGDSSATAARVLESMKLSGDEIRGHFERRLRPADGVIPLRLARRPQAKRAMRLAVNEAQRSGRRIGTEHLLLGIVRAGEGLAFELLRSRGITAERIVEAIAKVQASTNGASHDPK